MGGCHVHTGRQSKLHRGKGDAPPPQPPTAESDRLGGPMSSALLPFPLSQSVQPHQEGAAGGGSRAEQPRGSGMPSIQVTRGCEINGSSEEPRTAWRLLPGERKRLQAGLPPRPSSTSSQKPALLLPLCGATPQGLPSYRRPPTASDPSAQAPKGYYTKGCPLFALPQHQHLHCHLNLLSTA